MSSLIHCLYSSAARRPFEPAQLHELLAVARRNNQALDVTGLLLYVDGSFFQVLEGEEATVDRLYQRIALDTRHTKATVIIREPIAARSFHEWSMGFAGNGQRSLDDCRYECFLGTKNFCEPWTKAALASF